MYIYLISDVEGHNSGVNDELVISGQDTSVVDDSQDTRKHHKHPVCFQLTYVSFCIIDIIVLYYTYIKSQVWSTAYLHDGNIPAAARVFFLKSQTLFHIQMYKSIFTSTPLVQ